MGKVFNRIKALTAAAAVAVSAVPAVISGSMTTASAAGKAVVEQLDRGISAINTGSGMMVSWRYNATDSESAVFKLYRNDELIYTSEADMATSYLDAGGNASSIYKVETIENGAVVSTDTCKLISNSSYFEIPMDVPAGGGDYFYSPNDCSAGDVDGDGQYEIFVKWDPSNSQDNSKTGITGNVYIDCYKLTGQKLWRIDLGKNIRAGAHYTQFVVADFDLDGKAEMTCKTCDGTIDGTGRPIGNANAVYRDDAGLILTGPEYYTLFDGATGAALDTVNYEYPRGVATGNDAKKTWGDNYGNRCERYLGTAAYLDGVKPSAVSVRGYYTRMTVVAYDVVNKKLVKRWGYDTGFNTNAAGYGNGNHNLMPGDVDGDGKQEIVLGATCIDDNGKVLWCNNKGHGDAMHLGDLLPDRPGLELFVCHEHEPYGISIIDASNGRDIFHVNGDKDTGRCCADNIYAGNPGAEFWGARPAGQVLDGAGNNLGLKVPAMNFLAYWDGDLEREILDGNTVSKLVSPSSIQNLLVAEGCESNNSTKATPNLSADLFGDWREEVILRTSDNRALRVFTTPYTTKYRIATLMHDPQYRMQISAQQAGYNQPPHASFYLGSDKPLPGKNDLPTSPGSKIDTTKTYMIKNKNSGLFLTAESGDSGANVVQNMDALAEKSNYWTFEAAEGGTYYIKNCAGDVYLDITGAKPNGGTNVEVYRMSGSDAQLFRLIDNGDGSYVMATKTTGFGGCVEIKNAYTDNGANAQQWEINGHACQSWILVPVETGSQPGDNPGQNPGDQPGDNPGPNPGDQPGDNPGPNPGEQTGPAIIVGDLNHDGAVNVFDLIIMKRKGDSIIGKERQYADTNADGFVDTKDIQELTSFLLKKGSLTAVDNKCAFYYASEAIISQGVTESVNAGFKKDVYVNLDNVVGSSLEWNVIAPAEGNYLCNFFVANGATDNRPMKIIVNGGSDYWKQDFFTTSAWTNWETKGIVLPLRKGSNIIKMISETAGGGPNIDSLYMEKTDEPIAETFDPNAGSQTNPIEGRTVYIAGDSTVQTYRASYAPQQGWGAFLQENLSGVTVANHAIAGRSSKSFYDNGRLDTILNEIKSGDLLLVQFAINDAASSNAERYAPTCGSVPGTQGSYEWYLQKYIEGAKAKGATPVMVTTTIGLKAYDSNARKFVNSYNNYCDSMKKLASYYQIPCVDLNTLMVNHYNAIGYDAAYRYHMCSAAEGSTDMTHFTETGAKAVAKLVADDMKAQGIL